MPNTLDRWTVRSCPACAVLSPPRAVTCRTCGYSLGAPFEVQRVVPDEDRPGKARRDHGDTAQRAALKATPRTGSQRALVLAYLDRCAERGATRDQIAKALGLGANTVRPRVKELLDGGHVKATEFTRPSAAGHPAEVLVAAEHARSERRLFS